MHPLIHLRWQIKDLKRQEMEFLANMHRKDGEKGNSKNRNSKSQSNISSY